MKLPSLTPVQIVALKRLRNRAKRLDVKDYRYDRLSENGFVWFLTMDDNSVNRYTVKLTPAGRLALAYIELTEKRR